MRTRERRPLGALASIALALAFARNVSAEEPGRPLSAEEAPPIACTSTDECPRGAHCLESRCVEVVYVRDAVRPFRFGLTNSWFLGVAGDMQNPVPTYAVSADFGFPVGRAMRWHLELGYQDSNGFTGFRVSPAQIGYSLPLMNKEGVKLEAEFIATLIEAEMLFDDRFAVALGSGFRAQVVTSYSIAYAGFVPLGFRARYAYGTKDVGIRTGIGIDWPIQFTLGVEL